MAAQTAPSPARSATPWAGARTPRRSRAATRASAAAGVGVLARVPLERSYHVATLDFDRDPVEKRTVEFALRVSAATPG